MNKYGESHHWGSCKEDCAFLYQKHSQLIITDTGSLEVKVQIMHTLYIIHSEAFTKYLAYSFFTSFSRKACFFALSSILWNPCCSCKNKRLNSFACDHMHIRTYIHTFPQHSSGICSLTTTYAMNSAHASEQLPASKSASSPGSYVKVNAS